MKMAGINIYIYLSIYLFIYIYPVNGSDNDQLERGLAEIVCNK